MAQAIVAILGKTFGVAEEDVEATVMVLCHPQRNDL